eukprot:5891160-Amphidinium_carterae.2
MSAHTRRVFSLTISAKDPVFAGSSQENSDLELVATEPSADFHYTFCQRYFFNNSLGQYIRCAEARWPFPSTSKNQQYTVTSLTESNLWCQPTQASQPASVYG